jgi:hypothetical protein
MFTWTWPQILEQLQRLPEDVFQFVVLIWAVHYLKDRPVLGWRVILSLVIGFAAHGSHLIFRRLLESGVLPMPASLPWTILASGSLSFLGWAVLMSALFVEDRPTTQPSAP